MNSYENLVDLNSVEAASTLTNILYGAPASPFATKVRAYFRHKNIPFVEYLPSAGAITKVIRPRTGKMMIPIVITPQDQCLQDSSCIIEHFEERFPQNSIYPTSPKQQLVASLLECFGDEWLVNAAMHYRWDFKQSNLWFLINDLGKITTNNAPKIIHPFVGLLPYFVISRTARNLLGLNPGICTGVEKSFNQLIVDLDNHFKAYPYLLGERPSIADYSLCGVFAGCFFRDPHPKKILQRKTPNLIKWIKRVHDQEDARYGDFLPNDEVPASLIPVLKIMAKEQFPVLLATGARIDQWVQQHPERKSFPRVIGEIEFTVEGNVGKRKVLPYPYWMFQRSLQIYNQTQGQERDKLDQLLNEINGEEAFRNQAITELSYQNYKLYITSRI